ncbi:MAG: signal peptidase I [Bacteroidota bacterium]|nr:signal peptidase I [Bacteroidota bacterium]
MEGLTLLLIEFIIFEIASSVIIYPWFKAAGRASWESFVPFYKTWVTLKIVGRPKWWFIMSLLPVVSNVITLVMIYEMFHLYGYKKIKHTLLTLVTLGIYMGYIGYSEKLQPGQRDEADMKKRLGELIPAFLFAVVAAAIIRGFTFEAYTIPTSSMEKSLKVGDFLFVSKLAYGVRLPMTPLSIPLVHNEIPVVGTPSYSDIVQLPYIRLPKLEEIERNDAVVFNYPMETDKPIDKRMHYVKRCVAVAGDTLRIVNRDLYVNGQKQDLPERANGMFDYYVRTNGMAFNKKMLKSRFDINYLTPKEVQENQDKGDVISPEMAMFGLFNGDPNEYIINIPSDHLEEFKQLPNVEEVIPVNSLPMGQAYPENTPKSLIRYALDKTTPFDFFLNPPPGHGDNTAVFNYTRDNYGPLWVPREGATIDLTYENYLRYGRIIEVYEGNDLTRKGNEFTLNREPANTYTFQQNYYWMMGDNRHNSSDSRYWGFVPEDHIVGKPVFIWMSFDKYASGKDKIRTDRVFTVVHGEGERRSYFWPVLIILLGGYGVYYYFIGRKRKKNAA